MVQNLAFHHVHVTGLHTVGNYQHFHMLMGLGKRTSDRAAQHGKRAGPQGE